MEKEGNRRSKGVVMSRIRKNYSVLLLVKKIVKESSLLKLVERYPEKDRMIVTKSRRRIKEDRGFRLKNFFNFLLPLPKPLVFFVVNCRE